MADESQTDESQTDESQTDESQTEAAQSDAAAAQVMVTGEEVFVEGQPPSIPTSSTIAAKLPLPLQETPASVSIVSAELIDEQGGFVLGDALQNVAGINVQTGSGIFDFFVVRGIDSTSGAMILLDGTREPESSFYQLYNVDRVEVLKGPSSFVYGGSSMAGSVNLVRRQPVSYDQIQIGVRAGSFSTHQAELDANVSKDDGSLSFRLGSFWRESDNFRDDKHNESWAINPVLNYRPNEKMSMSFAFEVVDLAYQPDAGLPITFTQDVPEVPRERSYQSPFDRSQQDIERYQYDLEIRLNDRLVLRDKLYYRSLDWDSGSTIFNGTFPNFAGGLEISRSFLELDDRQDFYGNQFEAVMRLGSGRVEHDLLAGFELARQQDRFDFDVALLSSIDVFAPVESPFPPFPLPGQGRSADARSDIIAPYVVDQIRLSDRWQVLAGLRFDIIDFEDDVSGVSRSDDQLSPMLGVVFAPTPATSLYANASEAFAPPSTFAISEDQVPEESRQVEVGLKQIFNDGKATATLALYELRRENMAIPDETGVNQQVGDQRSRGVELEVNAKLGRGLQLFASYAYTDAELTRFSETILVGFFPPTPLTADRSGNTPAFAPEHILNFWLSRHLQSGLGFGLGGRYVDDQFIAEDNVFEIDAYFLLDAAIYYRRGAWRVSLNLDNLTDEEYLSRGFGATSVIPAPGFTSSLGLRYGF